MSWLSIFKRKPKPLRLPSRFIAKVIWSMKTHPQNWVRNGKKGFLHRPSGMTIWAYEASDEGGRYVEVEIEPPQRRSDYDEHLLIRAYNQYLEAPTARREAKAKAESTLLASKAVRECFLD